jgi:type I restriction enzyme R subunit
MDKKELSEGDIENLFITPALIRAGWDMQSQIRQNVTLTPGPVVVRGEMSARNKKKKKFADYVLSWKPGTRVAVIESKENSYSVGSGMQQALGYAEILGVPSAFSSLRHNFPYYLPLLCPLINKTHQL